jgi:outer membrane protein
VKTHLDKVKRALPGDGRRRGTLNQGAGADARRHGIAGDVLPIPVLCCVFLLLPLPAAHAQQGPAPLSLKEAVAAASGTSPSVSLASLRVKEAEGRLSQTRSVYLPSLGASAGFVRQTLNEESFGISLPAPVGVAPDLLIGPFNTWDARGEVSQTLFNPAGWLRVRAAGRNVTASRAELGTAQHGAAAHAGATYVAGAQALATLEARRQELDLAKDLQGVAEQQLKAGVATRLDLVRAQTQVAVARSGVEVAQFQVTQTQIDLARALGLPPEHRFLLTDTLGASLGRSAVPQSREEAVDLALAERPECRAARARRAAAGTAARAVGVERFGALRLVGNYGYNGISPDDWIRTGLVAAQYSIPLFEGGILEGRRNEQLAQAEEASVQLQDLERQVAADVESALEALQSGRARQAIAEEQLALAEEEEREARQLFGNGLAGNIEVINAQADLARAHTAVIEAQAQTALARVRLARAAGVTLTLE